MKNLWERVAIALVWLPAIVAVGLSAYIIYYILFLFLATPIILGLGAVVLLTVTLLWKRGLIQQKRWIRRNAFLSGVLVVLVYMTQFPFYLAYWQALPQLEAIAAAVRSHPKRELRDQQAGIFKVLQAGVTYHGSVYLWTHLNKAGNEGFIHCEVGKTAEDDCLTNEFYSRRLGDRWYYLAED